MIRGHFSPGYARAPYVRCTVEFPGHPDIRGAVVVFLIDTGADRTVLSRMDAERLGLNVSTLDMGNIGRGVGGEVSMRVVESTLVADGCSIPITLYVPEDGQPIPSLLGRDFMAEFALFMEERTGTVILFDREDVDALGLVF